MKQEEILEGNKLIAKFMGHERKESVSVWVRYTHWTIEPFGYFDDSDLRYHLSFDWLMPVISKIEKCGCIVEINYSLCCMCRICVIAPNDQKSFNIINDDNDTLKTPIDAVYASVTDFIKYYNSQSK